MITVATQGGLGNQMFQYAMGLAQANRLQTSLQIDSAANAFDSRRPFNLNLFEISEPTVQGIGGEVLIERNLGYDEDIDSKVKDGHTLLGYWQNEKYFQAVSSTLRLKFRSANMWPIVAGQYADLIASTGRLSTFIGIRRGDYVNSEYHGTLPVSYYEQGLERIRERLGVDPVVFVFSDDIEWAERNLKLPTYTTTYWRGEATTKYHIGREDLDLGLMAICNNAIIANSTFHWWGAWLGDRRRNGIVVAPKRWFLHAESQAQIDIVPDRWIKI